MAINKLVSIGNAFSLLGEETSADVLRMKPTLVRWGKYAENRIGSLYSYETNYYLLDVVNMKATLPLAAHRLDDMIIGDVLDQTPQIFDSIPPSYNETPATYMGEQIIWKWSTLDDQSYYNCYKLNWSVQDNQIVFQSSFTNTQITVKMLTYKTDVDGLPLVPENHIEAIASFLKGKIAMKEQWNKFKRGKLSHMDLAYINTLKTEYVNQARLSSAEDDNYSENRELEVSDMISNPFNGASNIY
jgi:hypothetical protein